MQPKKVEVIEKSNVFDGFFSIDRYCLRHESFKGGWGPTIQREIFERGHAVAVLPYDPNLDQVILTQQFRIGAFAARNSDWFSDDYSPWLIEGVAGIIESGETPKEVAYRESFEEIGSHIDKLDFVGHYFVSPGGTSETVFSFIGRVRSENCGGIFGIIEEGEELKTMIFPADEVFSWIDKNMISNGTTLIMLMWLRHHRKRIQKIWCNTEV